jgi:hypothetical protein
MKTMIEKTFERIATVLEKICELLDPKVGALRGTGDKVVPAAPKTQPASATQDVAAPESNIPSATAADTVPTPSFAEPVLTIEQLNSAAVEVLNKLGGDRSKIDRVIQSFGVTGLSQLDQSKYSEFLQKIQALV